MRNGRSTAEDVFARRARWAMVRGETEAWLRGVRSWTFGGGALDPPYAIGTRDPSPEEILAYLQGAALDHGGDFMGEAWSIPSVSLWRELLRTFKPGAYLAVFTSTSTDDLIGIGLRMAGWERRGAFELIGTGRLAWVQSQGMAKGSDIGKDVDEAAGVERDVVGTRIGAPGVSKDGGNYGKGWGRSLEGRADRPGPSVDITAPATPEAQRLDGYRTDCAPKHEPVLLFRAPFVPVTSEQLRAATGWDYWHVVTKADRPHQRAEIADRFQIIVPDAEELGVRTRRKRPLHIDVEEYTEVQFKEKGGEWVTVAAGPRIPYKPWKIATAASNALVYGTGGMNAGACRVFTDWSDRSESWKRSGHSATPEAEKIAGRPPGNGIVCHPQGRVCPDVWLVHTEQCREVGVQRVKGSGGGETSTAALGMMNDDGWQSKTRSPPRYDDPDGLETIAAYDCLATCPAGHETVAPAGGAPPPCSCGLPTAWACCVAAMDERVGLRKSGKAKAGGARTGRGETTGIYGDLDGSVFPRDTIGDEGFVSRFFHQDIPRSEELPAIYDPKCPSAERHAGGRNENVCVKPGSVKPQGLLRRLWRLILPPREVGFDGFAGCGSGPAAAAAEGLYVVGVEQNERDVEYAHKHIPALLKLAELDARGIKPKTARPERHGKPAAQVSLFEEAP